MTREDFIAFDLACATALAVQTVMAGDGPFPARLVAARDLLADAVAAYAEATAPSPAPKPPRR